MIYRDLVHLGEKDRAKDWASRSLIIEPDDPINQFNLACAMAQIGETDQALDLLEACSLTMPAVRINRIKQDPDLIPLHSHPRFKALVASGEVRLAMFQAERADHG